MKHLFIIVLLFLAGCSTCNIPSTEYSSFGGSETQTNLVLSAKKYTLTNEIWSAGNYENRIKKIVDGSWSCKGDYGVFVTDAGESTAEFKKIGENPLGLSQKTKALIFNISSEPLFSKEILYQKADVK